MEGIVRGSEEKREPGIEMQSGTGTEVESETVTLTMNRIRPSSGGDRLLFDLEVRIPAVGIWRLEGRHTLDWRMSSLTQGLDFDYFRKVAIPLIVSKTEAYLQAGDFECPICHQKLVSGVGSRKYKRAYGCINPAASNSPAGSSPRPCHFPGMRYELKRSR